MKVLIVCAFGLKTPIHAPKIGVFGGFDSAILMWPPKGRKQLNGCLERVRDWMASNRLKLNEDKTQIILLGTRHQLNKTLPQTLTLRNGTLLQFSTAVKNLGVLIDSQLTIADHIAAVCRLGFFQLRQLKSIRQSLTPAAVKTLVHAFISSRLDHCNQLFVGVTGRLLDKLQSLQNAAARLVTGGRKFDRITPVMQELHWLYQSGKGSGLRQPFWSSSASMEWLQNICPSTASSRPAVHICDQPTRACCLFRAHGQPTATGDLLSMDRSRGTVYLWHCVQVTSRRRLSEDI